MKQAGSVLLLVPVLVACGGRGEARILDVTATSPTALRVTIDACHADATLEQVTETATEVRVLVHAERRSPLGSSDCSDGVPVLLQAPLGERTVVDASSGRTLTSAGGQVP